MPTFTPLISDDYTHAARSLISAYVEYENTRKLVKRGGRGDIANPKYAELINHTNALRHENSIASLMGAREITRSYLTGTAFNHARQRGDGISFLALAPLLGVLGDPYLCQHTGGRVHPRSSVEDLFVHAGLVEPNPNNKDHRTCQRHNIHLSSRMYADDITHFAMMAVNPACTSPAVDSSSPYRMAHRQALESGERITLNTTSIHRTSSLYRNNAAGHIAAAKLLLTKLWDIAEEKHTQR